MRGNSKSQGRFLMNSSTIFQPKTSKHAKKQVINTTFRNKCVVEGIRPSAKQIWHNLGRNLDIFSYSTKFSYLKVWIQVLTFAKKVFEVKNIENLTAAMVESFLHAKIDSGVARSTFDAYASAMVKLERALNLYSKLRGSSKSYNFDLEPGCGVRKRAAEELKEEILSRAYYYPMALVCALESRVRLIAEIQYLAGLRVGEVLTLRMANLIGDGIIHLTNTKGGLMRIIEVPRKTFEELLYLIEMNGGTFLLAGETVENVAKAYRQQLKKAAIQTDQRYEGSHGLRWNYAREAYNRYIRQGMTPEQATVKVSRDLGHKRPRIADYYLR